jgi:hypothetical protein
MNLTFRPGTGEIAEIFGEEIAALGGVVTDAFDDGERLFARSTVPRVTELRPGDRVRGGVALRVTAGEIAVHPYTFRQVCTNGAIHAQAIQTRVLERAGLAAPPTAVTRVREAVRAAVRECAAPEAFLAGAGAMRSAAEIKADVFIHLLPVLGRMPPDMVRAALFRIVQRFERAEDRSLFGLMNAVTSLARDTRDPALRWQLEELGGGMAAYDVPRPKPRAPAEEAIAVGS